MREWCKFDEIDEGRVREGCELFKIGAGRAREVRKKDKMGEGRVREWCKKLARALEARHVVPDMSRDLTFNSKI